MKMQRIFYIAVCFALISLATYGQDNKNALTIKVDGSKKFQVIQGIGVNANTRSWNGKELEPALNLLLDSMHATIWRVLVETVEKWEDVNDNDDPFSFNWTYYNTLYETPKFQKVWGMMKYLNERGITDNLMINFMGFAPEWMGVKVIEPKYEDEFVEMISSFFYYAIKTKNLKFGLIAPTNETEHHCCKEGPHLTGVQHARILRKLIDRMESLKIMGNIRIVAPDNANTEIAIKDFMPAMMKDPVVMSRVAHLGVHSYGGYHTGLTDFIKQSPYPASSYWVTEWNAWCNGCDDGILGEYNNAFAAKCISFLLDLVQHGAQAAIAWEGYDAYYEHHAPSPFSYWGALAYNKETKTYTPRKNFYAIQQFSKFVKPGSRRIFITDTGDSLRTTAFYDSINHQVTLVGVNLTKRAVSLNVAFEELPKLNNLALYVTNETYNVHKSSAISVKDQMISTVIAPQTIFTITGKTVVKKAASGSNAAPKGWYAGDIHVHKNCGDNVVLPETELSRMMEENDLDVISLLADMGNGEVLYSKEDLPKVNGKPASISTPRRLIQWDAEWHYDATYSRFDHQALGGHLVLLGLTNAQQIWEESPYKILEWARKQNGITGFCHFQYLNDSIQNNLNCCIPIDFPVEVALGTVDFISEDVFGVGSPNNGTYDSEAAMNAYYKLLNCGFRPGLAAGTDYPCNANEPLGKLLTYVQIKNAPLSYRAWVEGIKKGNTVISRKGHSEFLDMRVNGDFGPGEVLKFKNKGVVSFDVEWTSGDNSFGRIELIKNGVVVATQSGIAKPGSPVNLKSKITFTESSWVSARRMDERGHVTHTAPAYISINNQPVRANADDAKFFIAWIDNILNNIKPDGPWSRYFSKDQDVVQNRYLKAKQVYEKILKETLAAKR